jgi:hypothetical protein
MKEAPVVKKPSPALTALFVVLALASTSFADRLTGSLKGRITDKQGYPLPGAFIYVSSPALLGVQNYITADTGSYAFIQLPPGTYKVTVEMPGFKTVNVDNLRMNVGKALGLNFKLEATDIEEEITSLGATPLVDTLSAKNAFVADKDFLRHAPLTRDFASIAGLAPGVVADPAFPDRDFAVHGSTVRSNAFVLGGIDLTDPMTMAPFADFNVDVVEEVEFETTSHPAETYPAEGGFINVVTKSGGNQFLGVLHLTHSSGSLSKELWSEEDLAEKGIAAPPAAQRHWDFSLNMGGPIIEDRAWFFTNVRLDLRSKETSFQPWTDPLGAVHNGYRWRDRGLMTFLKISTQVTSNIRAVASVNYQDRYQPVYESLLSLNTPKEASRVLDHDSLFAASGIINYRMDQNTFVDLSVGLAQRSKPLLLNVGGQNLPYYTDAVSGRVWGSAPFNEKSTGRRFKAAVSITRVQNGIMGIAHELRAGAEYEDSYGDMMTWKDDNLAVTYFAGSPYYYGTALSPKTGKTVGKGLVSFSLASKVEGGLILKEEMKRLGFYVQDALTIAQRATIHLGLRFDRSAARLPAVVRTESGNAVSVKIGTDLIKPTYGLNPYDQNVIQPWDQMMVWNALSPRAGLSVDLFGNGRSILKTSFSRYSEYLNLGYVQEMAPFTPTRSHSFDWYDEDGNGTVDSTDTFAIFPDDYRIYEESYFKKRVSPDAKAPYTNELTVGLHQEVIKDLTVSLEYIAKNQTNILENVLYDPDSGVEWYSADSLSQSWWVPFRTIVPAAGAYEETPVTVFFRSDSAPAVFDRLQNVPQLKRKYGAFELTVRKRMSDNWQFYSSVVWGKATGNVGLNAAASSGFSTAVGTPNSFVNVPDDSRLDLDRPTSIRLMGTYRFPWDFFLTLYFSRWSGTPWARSVTILPPDSWAQLNGVAVAPVTVFLEKPGSRRTSFEESLDLRIEKEFALKNRKRLRFFADVFNLLGRKSSRLDLNDAGFWFPGAENSNLGQRVISPTFDKYLSVSGARTVQISLSLEF